MPKFLNNTAQPASERIRNIFISLRNFCRADSDSKVFCNIHDYIDSLIFILKNRLRGNLNRPNIEIIKNYGNLPRIECFPGQLKQVFMNILVNAIDMFDEMAQTRSFAEIKADPQQISLRTEIISNQVKISI
ncbi:MULTISPECIES: hypothetical protein [unclassified Microcoleus]|uniref:hypothetical protein n=1 Tax=unclassified Microcoleus TaxID=2642155 RepID=UPI002FD3D221